MANIRGTLRHIPLNPEVLAQYAEYISTVDRSVQSKLQKILEKEFSNLYGKASVGGRGVSVVENNERLIPDYIVAGKSFVDEVVSSTVFKPENDSRLNIEAKVKQADRSIVNQQGNYVASRTSTTIGGSVLETVLPELKASYRNQIQGLTGKDAAKLLNQFSGGGGGEGMFNFLAKNAPAFHNKAYNKAKNLVLFYKNGTSAMAYEFHFPRSKFTAGIFGATAYVNTTSDKLTINYFLNNSFERAMVDKINTTIETSAAKGFKAATFEYGNTKNVDNVQRSTTINIEWAHTNSIPTAAFKVPLTPKGKPIESPRPMNSIVDITDLVRGRVRLKMARGTGAPRPTLIHERTGTFRQSIQAYANLKTKTINYFYTPYYDSLEDYGYEVNALVENSIRAIAKERFNKQFNLRRKVN